MVSQKQEAAAGSTAIQSQGDTNIVVHRGINADDMATILSALASQLPAYAAMAREIVDARLQEFQDWVLRRFANDPTANPNAFADPDFQYAITRAQLAFARSGDPVIRDTLVDLIERRSRENTRTRLALTLNEAMERSAYLTREEFAALSLSYMVKYVSNNAITNLDTFKSYLRTDIYPLLPDVPKEQAAYEYIEAQSCGSVGELGSELHEILTGQYGGIFTKGFSRRQLARHLPRRDVRPFDKAALIGPCINDPANLQVLVMDRHEYAKKASATGLPEDVLNKVWRMFRETFWEKNELLDRIGEPELTQLYSLWDTTALRSLNLTSVGIAIGHANAKRVCAMDADLAIWIK
jgi:hypothetical protein